MSQPPTQPSSNPSLYPTFPLMWNPPKEEEDDDESWEVRAFAEDTRNITGTTWPPRSYTCTFCRREFRSAQALGGHMNVHRRDRARLQLAPPPTSRSQLLVSSAHCSCNYTSNPSRSPLGVFENRAGFCLDCQQVASPNCHGVYVGSEPTAREAEPNYPEKGLHVDESGEGGNEEHEVREVELDLELRLGI